MTIDDVLDKALTPEHRRTGEQLQEYITNLHIPKLIDFFKEGLSPAERAAFERLSTDDQVAQLQNKHYMLKPDMADKFVNYLSAAILKKVSAPMGSQLEAAIAKMNDATLTVNERHAAATEVDNLKAILLTYGFNAARMAERARKEGFGPEIWNEFTRELRDNYVAKQQNAAMALVPHDEVERYLTTKVYPATGLKVSDVKAEGLTKMKEVALIYRQHEKARDVPGFKELYHQFH